MLCLYCLHNFCINEKETYVHETNLANGCNVQRTVNVDYYSRHSADSSVDENANHC